jgi:hypothetical protein
MVVEVPSPGVVRITRPSMDSNVSGITKVVARTTKAVTEERLYINNRYVASSRLKSFDWDSTEVPDGLNSISVRGYDSNKRWVGFDLIIVNVANGGQVEGRGSKTKRQAKGPYAGLADWERVPLL